MGNLPNCQKLLPNCQAKDNDASHSNLEICIKFNGADITVKSSESFDHLKNKFCTVINREPDCIELLGADSKLIET